MEFGLNGCRRESTIQVTSQQTTGNKNRTANMQSYVIVSRSQTGSAGRVLSHRDCLVRLTTKVKQHLIQTIAVGFGLALHCLFASKSALCFVRTEIAFRANPQVHKTPFSGLTLYNIDRIQIPGKVALPCLLQRSLTY